MDENNNTPNRLGLKGYGPRILAAIVIVLVGILFFFFVFRMDSVSAAAANLNQILQPVIFGIVIAYLVNPVMMFFERRLKRAFSFIKGERLRLRLSRYLGILISLAIVIAAIAFLGYLLLPELGRSIMGLLTDLPDLLAQFQAWLEANLTGDNALVRMVKELSDRILLELNGILEGGFFSLGTSDSGALAGKLNDYLEVLLGYLATGVVSVVGVVLDLVIGVIIAVYILASKESFQRQARKILRALFPARAVGVISRTASHSNRIFSGFIVGKVIDSIIVGVICFVALTIMDMPYTVVISVFVGVTNIIPFFGPFIGAIPSAILVLLVDPLQGLYFIIFILILQQVDGNIIGPRILGSSTNLSPLWVVVAVLLGSGLFGVVGMLIGVPLFAVVYYIVKNILEFLLRRRNLPTESADYASGESFSKSQDLWGKKE